MNVLLGACSRRAHEQLVIIHQGLLFESSSTRIETERILVTSDGPLASRWSLTLSDQCAVAL